MGQMRKAAALLLALLMMAGCEGPAPSSPPSAPVTQGGGELSGPGAETLEDTYYDYTAYAFPIQGNDAPARYRWNGDGTLTFQEQNRLHTLFPENKLLETVTIPAEHLTADTCYQFIWGDKYLLAVTADFSRPGVVYFTDDGGVHLANVTLFDRQGQLVRQYHAGPIYDNDSVPQEFLPPVPEGTKLVDCCGLYDGEEPLAYWLDDETAIFNGRSHIVLYDFANDTGRVLDDMSELKEKYGKFFVYYGAHWDQCGVMDGSFYYLARREEEKGYTLWRADKNGAEELFGGKEYWHLFVGQDALVLVDSVDPMAGDSASRVYIATPGENQPKEVCQGNLAIPFQENGCYLTFQNTFGRDDTVLYAYRRDTGELFQHDLGQVVQVNDLWVAEVEGSLRYYYTTFVNGTETDWVYDTATDATTQLPDGSVGGILSVSPDGSRILRRHPNGSRRLQVSPWPS